MSISVLSQASALNPGADLWIVPDIEHSHWTARIDWYLNFQVSKSLRHEKAALPAYLDQVQTATGLPKAEVTFSSKNQMLSSSQHLPNKWVIIVPWNNDIDVFCAEISKIWTSLKKPSLRVFLPPKQSTGPFQLAWKKNHDFEDFTVVLD